MKGIFPRSHLLREVSAILRWAFSFQTALLKFKLMLVFPKRGHCCFCPCITSGMDHLDGKWIGLSGRLTSPETSPSGISHLLGGCSVPLWLQSVLQTSVSGRRSEELQGCHLPLMGQATTISDRQLCLFNGNQRAV